MDLRKKVKDLSAIMEVSSIISSTLDFNTLMTLVMEKTKDVMNADACSILLYNKDEDTLEFSLALCQDDIHSDILKDKVSLKMGQGIAGWVAQHQKPILVEDAREDSRFFSGADTVTCFVTRSLIAVPMVGRSGLIGVAEIMNPKDKPSFNEYDLEIFQALARQVTIAIENSRFHQESLEREIMKQELEIATVIQESFLPESPVLTRGRITFSAISIPAKNVGGDLYEFTEPGEGKVGVLIGDISGKGISAALYMAKVISDFRYLAHTTASPEDALAKLNDMQSRTPLGMFITACYVVADTTTGVLNMAVAGHPPPILISGDTVEVLDLPKGPPVGILPVTYPQAVVKMKPGDRMVLLTDGAFDAKDIKGNRLGFEKLVKFVQQNTGEKNMLDAIVKHVNDFSAGAERADDLTIVEIDYA